MGFALKPNQLTDIVPCDYHDVFDIFPMGSMTPSVTPSIGLPQILAQASMQRAVVLGVSLLFLEALLVHIQSQKGNGPCFQGHVEATPI